MRKTKKISFALIFAIIFLLCSCLGVSADITLNQNGSGTIALEYKISQSLDSLGRLDGNERWNTIPAGKADFERTLDRLSGIKLLSFSSRDTEKNLEIRAKMEFENINALLSFMDAGGRRVSFSGDGNSGSLVLSLSEGATASNLALYRLIEGIFESYSIRISMSFPKEGRLTITDKYGNPLTDIPKSETSVSGRTVFFSFPAYEVISSREGINAEFRW